MNCRKLIPLVLVWALALLPGMKAWGHPKNVIAFQSSPAVCAPRALVVGTLVIQQGHCFTPLLLRTVHGIFLGFAPASIFIPPAQIIRLDTSLGVQIRSQIFSLVLVPSSVAFIPVNTIRLVIVRIEDRGLNLIISAPGDPVPVVVLPLRPEQSTAPLPGDVRILTPGPEVAVDEAAFSGKWIGEWKGKWRGVVEGTLTHTLVVEEIRNESPGSSTMAIVVFAWGTVSQWALPPGWHRLRTTFERGMLRLTLPSGARVTYQMSGDGTLNGMYERADFGTLQATMRRVEEQRL